MRKLLKSLWCKINFINWIKTNRTWKFKTEKDILKSIKKGVKIIKNHDDNYYKFLHEQYKWKRETIDKINHSISKNIFAKLLRKQPFTSMFYIISVAISIVTIIIIIVSK